MLIKEEVQAILKNKKHLFEQQNCNPGDATTGSNINFALERTKKGRVNKGKNYEV